MRFAGYIKRAWLDTWAIMGGWTALIPLVLIFPVGFALHYTQNGRAQAVPELQVFGVYGLQATGVVFGSFYLWNLVCAPYRITKDKLNNLIELVGLDKPKIRPDLNLNQAIEYLRASEEYSLYSLDDVCVLLTDLSASGQINIWGRDGSTTAFSYPVGISEEEKQERYRNLLDETYSNEMVRKRPLHNLSEFEHFKNQYIVHQLEGVDLLDGGNGAWVNVYVGSASGKFDLHFSMVELAEILGRPLPVASKFV